MAARWLGAVQQMRDDGEGVILTSGFLGIDSAEIRARDALGDEFGQFFDAGRELSVEEAWAEASERPA